MSIAVNDVVTQVRELFGETDASNSDTSAASLLIHLNSCRKDVYGRLPIYQTSATISGAGDSNQEHTFAYTTRIDKVFNGSVLIPLVTSEARFSSPYDRRLVISGVTRSYTSGYWIRGSKIGFHPALTASDTRTVHYWTTPSDVAAGESMDLPDYFFNCLVFGTLKYVFLKDRDPMWKDYDALFEKEVIVCRGNWNRSQFT
jgi:hypothetical protein